MISTILKILAMSLLANYSSLQGKRDYINNLWEDFKPNRGIVANVNNLDINTFTGLNGLQLQATLTTEDIPVNGRIRLTAEGQGFTIQNTNPGIAPTDASFSFVLDIDAPQAETNGSILFDNLGPTPRVILKSEISSVNSNLGIQWNGVDRDFGAAWPFGTGKHLLTYVFSGTEARCYIDYTQVGVTLSGLTGGQFAMNSVVSSRRFLRGASTIQRTFKKDYYGHRVYLEALSVQNLRTISNPSGVLMNPVPFNPVILVNGAGQSLESGSGAWGVLPGYLTGTLKRCFVWDNNARVLVPLSSTSYTLSSPILSRCYSLSQRFPSHDIVIVMGAVGGTNMDSWTPPSGARYIANKGGCDNAIAQLGIQIRTITARYGDWMHGQTDAENTALSAAYAGKESTFFTQWKTDFGHTKIISGRVRTDLPAPATLANINTINTGKQNNANADPNIILFNDTFSLSGDNLHHDTTGNVDLGNYQTTVTP